MNQSTDQDPKFWKTVRNDLHNAQFKRTFRQDYRELKEYFISRKRKERLKSLGIFRRFFYISWWLLKAMFYRLTPLRRLLFLVGIVFILMTPNVQNQDHDIHVDMKTTRLGAIMVVWVLMLELKDKLLAKDELRTGHAVQEALKPESIPAIPGWDVWLHSEPANEVGGDLIDFLPLGDNRFALTLGDVAGKGLGAALVMAKLQATIRALAPDNPNPDELAAKINTILRRDSLPSRFASLIYLELAAGNPAIRFINAGHMPPFLISAGNVLEIGKGGSALGLTSRSVYDVYETQLQAGEILLLYSDGITEATNENSKFFGEERLRKLLSDRARLSAARIGEEITQAVKNFRGDAPAHDDLSLIVIKSDIVS